MSILRSVIWNVLERITSVDLNNLQAIAAVNSQAAARTQSRSGVEQSVLPLAFDVRDNLAQVAGLEPTITGVADTLELTAGSLVTKSAAYPAPIPGEDFTPWRMYNGLDGSATSLTVPFPVALPTWYLLEARVGENVTSAVADIWNTTTKVFAPALVPKQRTTTLETQWKAGTAGGNWPSKTNANGWVPICYVLRAPGGGVIAESDVYDVRPLPSDLLTYASAKALNRQGLFNWKTTGANTIELTTVEPAVALGLSLEAGNFTAGTYVDLDLSTILDANDGSLSASTTYYLYIAPLRGLAPSRLDRKLTRGRLVLSSVAPTAMPYGGGPLANCGRVLTNSAQIVDPGVAGTWVNVAEGILVGAFRRNAANTAFVPMHQMGRTVRCEGSTTEMGEKRFTNTGPSTKPWAVPAYALTEKIGVDWTAANGAPISVSIQFTEYGTPAAGNRSNTSVRPASLNNGFDFEYQAEFDGADPTLTAYISDAAGAAPATYVISVTPRGWTW